MATAQSTAVTAITALHGKAKALPSPIKMKIVNESSIDISATLAKLPAEQLAELVPIECYEWYPALFREVWSRLGEKQKAFLELIMHGGDEDLADIRKNLKLKSMAEAAQVVSDLR